LTFERLSDSNKVLQWLKTDLRLSEINDELWRLHITSEQKLVDIEEQFLQETLKVERSLDRKLILG